jgi:hypothetical protein
VHALKDGRNTLKAHACVNRRAWKINALIRSNLLELHENEVPDFNETIAVFIS